MARSNKKKILLFTAVLCVILIFSTTFISCSLIAGNRGTSTAAATGITTYKVKKGNVIQSVSATGSVDTSNKINYALQASGKVLQVSKAGATFKKDDVLIELDNSDGLTAVKQKEIDLKNTEDNLTLVKSSIKIAKLDYQKALDSNHIAIQLADINTQQAQQAAASTYESLGNANQAADIAYRIAAITLDETLNSGKPLSEDEQALAQLKLESTKESGNASTSQAQSSYEKSQLDQSSSYWSNLSNLESAQNQIKTTQENINQASVKLDQAQLSLEQSQIALATAKADLDNYKISAPFDGIVLTSNYNQGETAGAGAAISIISNSFVIKTDINETDINKIKIGQSVDITLDAYPGRHFSGKVSEKSLISTNTSGVITFKVTIKPDDSANSSLLYGISANLNIIQASAKNVLFVPLQAVYRQNGKQYIDILTTTAKVTPKDVNKYLKQVEVTTGISNFTLVEITSGLKEGDVVITSGITRTGQNGAVSNQQSSSGTGNNNQTDTTGFKRRNQTGDTGQTSNSETESATTS